LSRRVSLPTADDLFRRTGGESRVRAVPDAPEQSAGDDEASAPAPERRPSGRVRHDEKMTVYVTSDELLDLEHTRLALRREHGLAVDRGRLVREAVAMVLADFDRNGDDSALVRRLTEG
jgi:hypothetical protein